MSTKLFYTAEEGAAILKSSARQFRRLAEDFNIPAAFQRKKHLWTANQVNEIEQRYAVIRGRKQRGPMVLKKVGA